MSSNSEQVLPMGKEAQINVYDSNMDWLHHARVIEVAGGFKFAEGPVWHPGQYFLFSDTPANKIYQLFTDGTFKTYLDKSGLNGNNVDELSDQVGSNGLVLDKNNNLLICQHGNHAIGILNKRNELDILVNEYNGIPFNSPNDITIRSDGAIFFTDPPYGLSGQVLHPENFQPLAGIYKYDFNKVELVGAELNYPNGLFFSADEKYLFVSSNHPDEPCILKYRSFPDGSMKYKGVFLGENADGMTTDKTGNIYLATNKGILIVSPQSEKLAFVSLRETPSNLAWGGKDNNILFVTARSVIYFIIKE